MAKKNIWVKEHTWYCREARQIPRELGRKKKSL